jgi:hypothetical protein
MKKEREEEKRFSFILRRDLRNGEDLGICYI